ncbi:MAG: hypothetical protein KIT87_09115 [Anaerolineae bacterium]|nr:hypothetical protein [Anaerolineae bacterium]
MDAQREALLLDECLRRLQAGDSVEACLAHLRHAEADALRPILETVLQVRLLRTPPPPPNPAKRAASRALFLAEAARLFPATAPNGHVHPTPASPERLMALVETIVGRVRGGESLADCLADYPAEAGDLSPLVETALGVQSSFVMPPAPDPDKRAAARAHFLAEAARLFEDQVMAGLVRAELRDIQATPGPILAEEREGRLMGLVDAVIARVRAGESLDKCLADYPAEARELRPLLQTALGMAVSFEVPPPPSPTKRAAARARFLASAAKTDPATTPAASLSPEALMGMVDTIMARVRAGESLAICLAEHPTQAHELRPLVETALGMQASFAPAPAPNPAKRAAARSRFLAAAQEGQAPTPVAPSISAPIRRPSSVVRPPSLWDDLAGRARLALAAFLNLGSGFQRVGLAGAMVFLMLCMATTGVVRVSAASLPGDPLYTVKEATRAVQLALTFDPEERERVIVTQEREKQDEILQVAERRVREGEPVQAPAFTDIVTEIDPSGLVRVGKVLVRLQPGMTLEVGSRVQVKGAVGPDGVVQVTQVVVLAKPATQVVEKPAASQSVALAPSPTPTLPAPTATATAETLAVTKPTSRPTDIPASPSARPSQTHTPAPTATEKTLPTLTATARPILLPSATASMAPVEATAPAPAATLTPESTATRPAERPREQRTSVPSAIDIAGFFVGGSGSGSTEVWRIIADGQTGYEIELTPQTVREGPSPRPGDSVLARGIPVSANRIRASRVAVTGSVGTSRPGEPTPASVTVRGVVVKLQRLSDREAIWTIRLDDGRPLTVYETAETAEVSGINGPVDGLNVTVTYHVVNGQNVAERIRVEPRTPETTVIRNVIAEIHADYWVVGNTRVQVTNATVITPPLADYTPIPYWDWAKVTGRLENGVLVAQRIEVQPTPTRTPPPATATSTPLPPTSTNTSVPPSPTRTVTPVPPTWTNTPIPPSATPRPTEAATATPKPVEAASATPAPAASATPKPTATQAK